MTKTILALSTALVIAASTFASVAEAGSCGGGGYRSHYYGSSSSRGYTRTSGYKKASKSVAAATVSKKTAVAEAERDVRGGTPLLTAASLSPATADKAAALAEPAVATLDSDVADVAEKAVEARDLGCKRFIPAAGLTISVSCGE